MTDPIRLPKTTIKETLASNSSPAVDQKQTQTGIASAKDSFQVKQESSLFTANPTTGEVKFGDGVQGKRPPEGTSAALLYQSKSEISSYLKGESKTFLKTKDYMLGEQNKQIDQRMKEAGEKADATMNQATTGLVTGIVQGGISIGTAVKNLKYAALEAKNEVGSSNNPAIEYRFKHFNSALKDLEMGMNPSQSKKLQMDANLQDAETKRLENSADKDSDFAGESKAHADRFRDAILDFLRKLHDIDPQILK